jgi:HSP20 family protein
MGLRRGLVVGGLRLVVHAHQRPASYDPQQLPMNYQLPTTTHQPPTANWPCASIDRVAFALWDPIRDLLAIQQRLERFAPGPEGWVPPCDLYETAESYILTAEVAGLRREDIQIQLHDGHLTVSGKRSEQCVACEQFHRMERGHGSFSRTFNLPSPVDQERISADLRDGLLTVTCPKAESGVRRIRIT